MIIAIGGGSIIDYGKLMMYFIDEADVLSFIKGNLKPKIKDIPFLAIPTTFGSGSEATSFAVLYHQNAKYSVSSPLLLPKTSGVPILIYFCKNEESFNAFINLAFIAIFVVYQTSGFSQLGATIP